MQVPEPDAERDREQQGDPHRGAAQLEVLDDLRQDQVRVVADEVERVDERVRLEGVGEQAHVALRSRVHGISARCAVTSRTSAARASAIASAPVAMNSVWKLDWSP